MQPYKIDKPNPIDRIIRRNRITGHGVAESGSRFHDLSDV